MSFLVVCIWIMVAVVVALILMSFFGAFFLESEKEKANRYLAKKLDAEEAENAR